MVILRPFEEPVSASRGHDHRRFVVDIQFDDKGQFVGVTPFHLIYCERGSAHGGPIVAHVFSACACWKITD